MQQVQVPVDDAAVGQLAGDFGGTLMRQGDQEYDAARAVFNGMFDRRPALIAQCGGVADVIAAVRFASEHELEVAVRCGGHSVPGYACTEGGIVIDLRDMNGVWVDPAARTARAQGGATWGKFDRETQAFGLATTGGRITTTGLGGLTLGSGSGWLERKFGWTVDNLLSADLVTAAGEVVRASETENEELFWGLRGGGGNFGIVTSFEYRLHELGPIVLGGMLLHAREKAPELLRDWRDVMRSAPDEVGSAFAFLTAPPLEFVPEALRGRPACGIVFLYAGPAGEGEEAAQALRSLSEPDVDLVMPMPYTVVQQLLDAPNPPGRPQYWKSDNVRELTDPAIETLTEQANRVTSPFTIVILEAKGGAIARVPDEATALSGRDSEVAFYGIAQWEDPAEPDQHLAWAREFGEAMEPFGSRNAALNFVMDEGQERVQSTYGPEKYARLVALKDEYDPGNLFRRNQNIRPSGAPD
jgi:FAD/FMN-containing dehydrogenase